MSRLATAPRASAVPARGARVALWDNARLLLIALVVFGHLIESLRGSPLVDGVYAVVYSFHMPAFLLAAGWFAHGDRPGRKQLLATARLLGTWFVAEAAWVLLRLLLGEQPLSGTFLVVPAWTLWFLVSLVTMRVLLPTLALARHPVAVAVVLALAAGLLPAIGAEFSASRTLALLPFFVLGWWLRRRGVGRARWFRRPSARLRAAAAVAAVAAAGAVVAVSAQPFFTVQLLWWRQGYTEMDLAPVSGLLLRAFSLAVGAVLVGALLILVPRRRTAVSAAGRNTLTVYLLQAPVVDLLRHVGLPEAVGGLPVAVPLMLVLAAAITAVLSLPVVTRVMRPVLEPDLLLRADPLRRRARAHAHPPDRPVTP